MGCVPETLVATDGEDLVALLPDGSTGNGGTADRATTSAELDGVAAIAAAQVAQARVRPAFEDRDAAVPRVLL